MIRLILRLMPVRFDPLSLLLSVLAGLWTKEAGHEETRYDRGSIGDVGGRGLDRYKRHGEEAMGRLMVRLLPERVNLSLWHALRERYAIPATHTDYVAWSDSGVASTNDVPYAPI